jgi:hypothetical protein
MSSLQICSLAEDKKWREKTSPQNTINTVKNILVFLSYIFHIFLFFY